MGVKLLPTLLATALLLTGCSFDFAGAAAGQGGEKLLLEVWQTINRDYIDGTFGYQDWEKTRQGYLDKISTTKTPEEGYRLIGQMVDTVKDPYTRFLSPKEFNNLQSQVKGELSGVGLQIAQENSKIVVISPVEGSPAFKAGIKPRDTITAIDGKPTQGLDLDQAAQKLRGPVGTRVAITLQRGSTAINLKLVRATVEINPVVYRIQEVRGKRLGYVGLRTFNGNAATELKKAITSLEKSNVSAYILDLRFNPGGLVVEGVEIARFFLLPRQNVVSTVSRQGMRDVTLSSPFGPLTRKPLVVLVNGGSASASEILAGALQDNQRAKLVGTKTFGKGLIQQVYTLPEGAGLTVSIARYQTPSGKDIHKVGIQPDIVIDLPPDLRPQDFSTPKDPQFARAAQVVSP